MRPLLRLTKKELLTNIAVTFTHILLIALALQLVTPEEKISLMWLPDGFLLGVLVLYSYRQWPLQIVSIALASFLFEIAITDRPPLMITAFIFSNLVESVVGAYIFKRVCGAKSGLSNFTELSYFLIFCVLIIPSLSALISTYTIYYYQFSQDFIGVYRTWISSASLGILFIAPVVIFSYKWYKSHLHLNPKNLNLLIVNLVCICTIVFITSYMATQTTLKTDYAIYITFPFLCLAAIKLGLFGALTSSSLMVVLLIWLTSLGIGPFNSQDLLMSDTVFKLQVYLGAIIVSVLYIGIAVDSLDFAAKQVARGRLQYKSLFDKSPIALWEEDFSEVKRYLDKKLKRTQLDIASWFNQNPDEIAKCAQKVKIVEVNDRALQLFGASSTPELLSNLNNIFTEESIRVFQQEIVALYNGSRSFRAEAEQRKIDGSLVYTITAVNILEGHQETWHRAVVSIEDITDRILNERKLTQAAAVYASTSEGVVVTNIDGDVVDINQAFCNITGYSIEEVNGHNLRFLKSDRHDNHFYKNMWSSLKEHGHWCDEIWNRKKDGSVYPELLTINTIYDNNEKPINYVAVFSDISKIKETEEKLHFLAHHDPLTNLPNRLLFKDRFSQAIKAAQRKGTKLGFLFLDIDRFKVINDSLGHAAGDQLLIEVAKKLKRALRQVDTVARISGDEFSILLEDLESTQFIDAILKKILLSFEQPIQLENEAVVVSLSTGVSIYPDDGTTIDALFRCADAALYEAKDLGRNTYQYFTPELNAIVNEQLELEQSLHLALPNRELFLVYQPQIELTTGNLIGVEALLRWRHPEKGLIPPDKFIPLAEKSGLIKDLGHWVLEHVCQVRKHWLEHNVNVKKIAVNVSGVQLQSSNFATIVKELLNQYQYPASELELEVTESFVMKKITACSDQLKQLQELGIEISIDDFGKGYSSLSYLKRLPIDKLKIDHSFVMELPQSQDDAAIVKAILAMSHALGMTVIAEGVETQAQATYLQQQGCEQGQGYLFDTPLSENEVIEKFKSRS